MSTQQTAEGLIPPPQLQDVMNDDTGRCFHPAEMTPLFPSMAALLMTLTHVAQSSREHPS